MVVRVLPCKTQREVLVLTQISRLKCLTCGGNLKRYYIDWYTKYQFFMTDWPTSVCPLVFDCPILTLYINTKHTAVISYCGVSWDSHPWRNVCACVTHQSHVICQYSPTNSLWDFLGRETGEAVVVQITSFLPEGWQWRFVFLSTHPGQRLPLVKHERCTNSLWRDGPRVNITVS